MLPKPSLLALALALVLSACAGDTLMVGGGGGSGGGGGEDELTEEDVVGIPAGTAMGTDASGVYVVSGVSEECGCPSLGQCTFDTVSNVVSLFVSQTNGRLEIRLLGEDYDPWLTSPNVRLIGALEDDGSFRVGAAAVMRDADYLPLGDELHEVEGEIVVGERIELVWRARAEWAVNDRDCEVEYEMILGPTDCRFGWCPPAGAPGDPCEEATDCRTGSCGGACEQQVAGETCWIDADCASGLCLDAVCS